LPLRIAGTGPEEERLHQLADLLDARHISFLGFVPPADLERLREQAEAVAVPSVWYENSPLSALEALGQGVPVLASDTGGLSEIVRDGQEGMLAAPGKITAWVDMLQRFQNVSADDRLAMGERGRQRIRERHDWSGHLAGLEKIYHGAGVKT